MKNKLLLSALLMSGLILTGCGEIKTPNDPNIPNSGESENQPGGDETTKPDEGTTPDTKPEEGTTPEGEGTTPDTKPDEGTTPDTNPDGGETNPEEGEGGESNPGDGEKPDSGDTDPTILTSTLDFSLPESHYKISNYNEGTYIDSFISDFMQDDIVSKAKNSIVLDSVFGGDNGIENKKYLPYIRIGSSKNIGSLSFQYNLEIVKEITKVEVEVFPYLITYTNTVENAKLAVNDGKFEAIPAVNGNTIETLTSAKITYEGDLIKDPNKGFSLKTENLDAPKGGGRCFVKNIKITYIKK